MTYLSAGRDRIRNGQDLTRNHVVVVDDNAAGTDLAAFVSESRSTSRRGSSLLLSHLSPEPSSLSNANPSIIRAWRCAHWGPTSEVTAPAADQHHLDDGTPYAVYRFGSEQTPARGAVRVASARHRNLTFHHIWHGPRDAVAEYSYIRAGQAWHYYLDAAETGHLPLVYLVHDAHTLFLDPGADPGVPSAHLLTTDTLATHIPGALASTLRGGSRQYALLGDAPGHTLDPFLRTYEAWPEQDVYLSSDRGQNSLTLTPNAAAIVRGIVVDKLPCAWLAGDVERNHDLRAVVRENADTLCAHDAAKTLEVLLTCIYGDLVYPEDVTAAARTIAGAAAPSAQAVLVLDRLADTNWPLITLSELPAVLTGILQ